jgi:ribonuclease HI
MMSEDGAILQSAAYARQSARKQAEEEGSVAGSAGEHEDRAKGARQVSRRPSPIRDGDRDTQRGSDEAKQRRRERSSLRARPKRVGGGSAGPIVEVFTDGGCWGNPGPGGWAAVVYEGPKPKEISGSERETTNNRMELKAAIEGLKALKAPSRVRLFSDSAYLVNAFEKGWVSKWEHNGWRNAKKKPVENQDLWRELVKVSRLHDVEWVKVAGHAGIPANERCHALVQRELR